MSSHSRPARRPGSCPRPAPEELCPGSDSPPTAGLNQTYAEVSRHIDSRYHAGLAALVFGLALWLCPAALAWQNGSAADGYRRTTVQEWIVANAVELAVASGADWVDLDAALATVDDPDTVLRDDIFHSYDRWGRKQGGRAPQHAGPVPRSRPRAFGGR